MERRALLALSPLGLALLALLVRETTRPAAPAPLQEGRALPVVPPPLPDALARGRSQAWRVVPDRSSARVVGLGGAALDLGVRGTLEFGADGALGDVELSLSPAPGRIVLVSGASTPCRPSAVPIVGSAQASLWLERDGTASEWRPRMTWTRHLDGSAACLLAGELSLDQLGLPQRAWTRILHGRRPAWLALVLSLAEVQ